MPDKRFFIYVAALTTILVMAFFMPASKGHANDSWQPLPSGTVQRPLGNAGEFVCNDAVSQRVVQW